LLAKGVSNHQIANELFIIYDTVRKQVKNIYDKLHINRKARQRL